MAAMYSLWSPTEDKHMTQTPRLVPGPAIHNIAHHHHQQQLQHPTTNTSFDFKNDNASFSLPRNIPFEYNANTVPYDCMLNDRRDLHSLHHHDLHHDRRATAAPRWPAYTGEMTSWRAVTSRSPPSMSACDLALQQQQQRQLAGVAAARKAGSPAAGYDLVQQSEFQATNLNELTAMTHDRKTNLGNLMTSMTSAMTSVGHDLLTPAELRERLWSRDSVFLPASPGHASRSSSGYDSADADDVFSPASPINSMAYSSGSDEASLSDAASDASPEPRAASPPGLGLLDEFRDLPARYASQPSAAQLISRGLAEAAVTPRVTHHAARHAQPHVTQHVTQHHLASLGRPVVQHRGRMITAAAPACPLSPLEESEDETVALGCYGDAAIFPPEVGQAAVGRTSKRQDFLRTLEAERERQRRLVLPKNIEKMCCKFCKNNGESAEVYTKHRLLAGEVTACPLLRHYVCRLCGGTGDHAHTISHCPLNDQRDRALAMAMDGLF